MLIAIVTKEKKNIYIYIYIGMINEKHLFYDKHTSTKGIESSISKKHYNMYHDHNALKHFAIWLVVIFYINKI